MDEELAILKKDLKNTEEALSDQIRRNIRLEARVQKAEYTLNRLRRLMDERRTHKFWYVRVTDVLEVLDGKDLEGR